MLELAKGLSAADRERLREGISLNLKIAEHGMTLFPERFVDLTSRDELSKISTHVCAAVYARMWGEEYPVMTLAGSGNKGLTASIPLAMWEGFGGYPKRLTEEALALACLVTSATTHHLGTLAAVCGCSNAAGIGLAAGLVLIEKGGTKEISLAINNMVGNVTGMICDGAKIGCALKTMTAVDAAFRSSTLAMSGVGIPSSDGIVGGSGPESLKNLGRISNQGMLSADSEILRIMREKLAPEA
jgi:L-cysteine desulfidase